MNNTEEIFDTILPIGSIVLTENGEVPLMIVGRASLFEQDGETGSVAKFENQTRPF